MLRYSGFSLRLVLSVFLSVLLGPLSGNALNLNDIPNQDGHTVVPTFECLGIYYNSDDQGECRVQYQKAGTGEWKPALDLVYDPRDEQYRGSIVELQPDTEYQVRITCGGKETLLTTRTRSDDFPVGKITLLEDGVRATTLIVTESGTPEVIISLPRRKGQGVPSMS